MKTWRSYRGSARQMLALAALALGAALAGCAHGPGETPVTAAPSQAMTGSPASVVHHYFQSLEQGRFNAALALWRADAPDRPSRTRLQQTYAGLARLRSSMIGDTVHETTPRAILATVRFRIIEYRMLAQRPRTYSGECVLRSIRRSSDNEETVRRWQIDRLDWRMSGPGILRSG